MRFTFIVAVLGAIVLLFIFGFLLLNVQKKEVREVPAVQTPRTSATPSSTATEEETSSTVDVSQENVAETTTIGSDFNMEFPTLDE